MIINKFLAVVVLVFIFIAFIVFCICMCNKYCQTDSTVVNVVSNQNQAAAQAPITMNVIQTMPTPLPNQMGQNCNNVTQAIQPPMLTPYPMRPKCYSQATPTPNAMEPKCCSQAMPTLNVMEPKCSQTMPTPNAMEPKCSQAIPTLNVMEPKCCSQTMPTLNVMEPKCSQSMPTPNAMEPKCSQAMPTPNPIVPNYVSAPATPYMPRYEPSPNCFNQQNLGISPQSNENRSAREFTNQNPMPASAPAHAEVQKQ